MSQAHFEPDQPRILVIRKGHHNQPLYIKKLITGGLRVVIKTRPVFHSKVRFFLSRKQTFWQTSNKDDIIREARNVVREESPYSDSNHYATVLKWSKGVLDYHSAKALLDKEDTLTDRDIAPFLTKRQ
jgi:hypothetical protein